MTNTEQLLSEIDEELDGAPTEVQLAADLDQVKALVAARDLALKAACEAEDTATRYRFELETLRRHETELRESYIQARDTVADLDPPTGSSASLHDDWTDLKRWAKSTIPDVENNRAGEAENLRRRTEERAAIRQAVEKLCRPHIKGNIAPDPRVPIAQAESRARSDLEQARARRAELDAIRAKVTGLGSEGEVARELGRLLHTNRFERWLMEEAMVDLAGTATERLYELSGGQYSLIARKAELSIQDHRNADEVRDTRTLSGGETFLASLSLALALADNVAEFAQDGSPQLGSIFLDEGFGTLDPETLDVVASAIEELGSTGRMVGIITHIRDLADRMPVRFEVVKNATSSTVERVEV